MVDSNTEHSEGVVYDFTYYFLRRMADDAAKHGKRQLAEACEATIEAYVEGRCDIEYRRGVPYVIPRSAYE